MRGEVDARNGAAVVFSDAAGSSARRLEMLLAALPASDVATPFDLDDLSLALGLRLPDQAGTLTYWHRGDLGRALRGAGFGVRVELGRVIFVRRADRSA